MEVRAALEQIDAAAADDDEAAAAVAYVVAQRLEQDLTGPIRRSLLLLAAGGDPHRPIDTDSRAVKALADELDADALARALSAVSADAGGLARVERVARALAADSDAARRLVALAALADELD